MGPGTRKGPGTSDTLPSPLSTSGWLWKHYLLETTVADGEYANYHWKRKRVVSWFLKLYFTRHIFIFQWRIQDFPQGGRQLPKLLLSFTFLPKTAWKWKNLDPQGGRASLAPPLDPPMSLNQAQYTVQEEHSVLTEQKWLSMRIFLKLSQNFLSKARLKILKDNHYETSYLPVRSECSSCRVQNWANTPAIC